MSNFGNITEETFYSVRSSFASLPNGTLMFTSWWSMQGRVWSAEECLYTVGWSA